VPAFAAFFGRRPDLGLAELDALERIRRRRDAARHHQLDLVGPAAEVVAHRTPHLVGPVDHNRPGTILSAHVARAAGVSVAAGLGQGIDRYE
jgi:hypothetical protein